MNVLKRKSRLISAITIFSITFTLLFGFSAISYAAESDNYEPNNSMADATSVTTDARTYSFIQASGDVDYFKYLMPANTTEIITILGDTVRFNFELVDENGNTIQLNDSRILFHTVNNWYGTPCNYIEFRATTSQYVYVRFTGVNNLSSTSNYYTMWIGGPQYTNGSITINPTTAYYNITSNYSYSQTLTFDLTNNALIPDKSIVKRVSIGGTESGSATGRRRQVKPLISSTWISCDEFMFNVDNLDSQSILMKQQWQFRHYISTKSGSVYGLRPSIMFDYVFPMGSSPQG